MSQRASGNSYSWWWSSNVSTKQSKWLDSDLQEMEALVKAMLKLIDEDADSFAKKAELYFKRRPELIKYVEEMYRNYKALADRFDRISGELHKVNHTIATVFPDQVHLFAQDEDVDGFLKAITSIDPSNLKKSSEFPHLSTTEKNKDGNAGSRKTQHKKMTSHLSKETAQEEVDMIQKEILELQTEKEFLKSSYMSGLEKYREIERQINEMQVEVCVLQGDFSAKTVIEDDELRALTAARAIKSCEDTLVILQEQQKIASEEARVESERIRDAKDKLNALKNKFGQSTIRTDLHTSKNSSASKTEEESFGLKNERLELQSICQKVKEQFALSSETSIVEASGKIDELVDKVIGLELAVSSQTAQIKMLKTGTDELQTNLHSLEEDKAVQIGDSKALTERLKQAEEELQRIMELEKSVQEEKGALCMHLAEACQSFNDLSEKLQSRGQLEQADVNVHDNEIKENANKPVANLEEENDATNRYDKGQRDPQMALDDIISQLEKQLEELDDAQDMQFANGVEGKENILLAKFTHILQNYKNTKRKLADMEKKNQEDHSDPTAQVCTPKNSNTLKDEEIRLLKEIVSSLQANINANATRSEKSEKQLNSVSDSHRADEDTNLSQVSQPEVPQSVEDKLKMNIETVLEENLDFWFRFSSSYHQMQKFETTSKELKDEIQKLNEIKSHEASGPAMTAAAEAVKQESFPLDRKLRSLSTELEIWLEKNALLQHELQSRFSNLCNIQDEISRATNISETEDKDLTPFQAAKFQGEVLSMQLENNKVAKELQTGLDHVRSLQMEIGRALMKNRENFESNVSRNQNNPNQFKLPPTKTNIPLQTFLFGAKPKKPSLFSRTFQKKYSGRSFSS